MSSNKILVSVIVPIYNAEETLDECIRSIIAQSNEGIELILVDDGSTDSSGNICEEYCKKYSFIKTIHISNSGIFQARKEGVKAAEGEYVTFVDSDDWIEEGAFNFAINTIKSNPEIDMISYAYRYNNDDEIEINRYKEGIYVGEEIYKIISRGMMFDSIIGERRLNPSLCTKYIRREIYNVVTRDINENISLGEDALVTYSIMCRVKKIGIYNIPFYHYRVNPKSCTHIYPFERIEQILSFYKNMRSNAEKFGYLDVLEEQITNYTRTLLSMAVKNWFGFELTSIPYVFPMDNLKECSKIVIYGAGVVGKSYVKQLCISKILFVTGWFDKNYKNCVEYMGVRVDDPENIINYDFDKIIIAVKNEVLASQIKKELIDKHPILSDRIIWIRPNRNY